MWIRWIRIRNTGLPVLIFAPVLEFQVSVLRKNSVLRIRIRDPVPFRLLIRDLGWVKSKDPDPEWKIRIRAPDGKSRIRYKHPGSATLKN